MKRRPLGGNGDALGERVAEADPIGEGAKCVQADVGDNAGSSAFHPHATGAGSVSSRKCPPGFGTAASNTVSFSYREGVFASFGYSAHVVA